MKKVETFTDEQSLVNGKKNWLNIDRQLFFHYAAWLLVVAALFYGMHQYFEYRDQQLDERLEQLN